MSGTLSVGGKQVFTHSDMTDKVAVGSGFPPNMIVKMYFTEDTEISTSSFAIDQWHTLLTITTDVPLSTSSNFILTASMHAGVADWGVKYRFYNSTTNQPISINTNTNIGSKINVGFVHTGDVDTDANHLRNVTGMGRQIGNNGSAQTFVVQGYSGRTEFWLNRAGTLNDDDITGNLAVSTFTVMEISG